mmetsp:Transcript_64617/g.151866  ORF Transcript_64617/g.151866 Transcript_64617/m.151866 type:complete len:352 (-) Transcript_64617:858-1913(-)
MSLQFAAGLPADFLRHRDGDIGALAGIAEGGSEHLGFPLLKHPDHLAELHQTQRACVIYIHFREDTLNHLESQLVAQRTQCLWHVNATELTICILLLRVEKVLNPVALLLTEALVPPIELKNLPNLAQVELLNILQVGAALRLKDDPDVPGIVAKFFEKVGHLVTRDCPISVPVCLLHGSLHVLQLHFTDFAHADYELAFVDGAAVVNVHLLENRHHPVPRPREAQPVENGGHLGSIALSGLVPVVALEDQHKFLVLAFAEAFSAQDQLHDCLELVEIQGSMPIDVNFRNHLVKDMGHGLHVQAEQQVRELGAFDDTGAVLVTSGEGGREGEMLALLVCSHDGQEVVQVHC